MAITANLDPPNDSVDAISEFVTTGASMAGMTVRATFDTEFVETATWVSTGASSGGAFGTGWSVSVDGDTFSATWTFTIDGGAGLGHLMEVFFDGTPGGVLFDRGTPQPGTAGSFNGSDFFVQSGGAILDALYDRAVGIGAAAPVGDLFRELWLTAEYDEIFGSLGPTSTWTFTQDTDKQLDLPLQTWTLTRISDL